MKVKCLIEDKDFFTKGEEYEVHKIDSDGDFWVFCDDGDAAFLNPSECEIITNDLTSNVVQMFSKPNQSIVSDNHYTDELSSWKEKNAIISNGFHKESVFQKQRTLDAVLAMNEELVELVVRLKSELKGEKG